MSSVVTDLAVVPVGSVVTFTVTGMIPNEPYRTVMTTAGASAEIDWVADGSGNYTGTYLMPAALEGTCTLKVVDADWVDASTTFTVVPGGNG